MTTKNGSSRRDSYHEAELLRHGGERGDKQTNANDNRHGIIIRRGKVDITFASMIVINEVTPSHASPKAPVAYFEVKYLSFFFSNNRHE